MAEWFKRVTDVLADQLFALQLVRLRAVECNTSVSWILDKDATTDGLFLALNELQERRRQLVDRFDECPTKFKWNALYCLCAIDILVGEVFVDEEHPKRKSLNEEVMTRAANTRDLDALVTEQLLFDFFWRADGDLLNTLNTAIASTGILCTQRSLPYGSAFAPIPCTQCRFDHAFSPETEIVQVTCTHLAGSLAPFPPDAKPLVPDLPSTLDESPYVVAACRFPVSDRAFDHLDTPDCLKEFLISCRSSGAKVPPAAASTEAARMHLVFSKASRDCEEERAELVEIRTLIREAATQRQNATCCKVLGEWTLLRLVEVIDALARRQQCSSLAGVLESMDRQAHRAACTRLRRNLCAMVLQDAEQRQLSDAFNDLVLDPLTRDSQRIFRPYIDSRKLMYSIGVPPTEILKYDQSLAEITNKNVFELQSRDPRDQFFKAVYVSGLFRLYLSSIGCDPECVPALFRADDRVKVDGFCFSVDGDGVVAAMHDRYFARATNETILPLCIAWIRELVAREAAGDATDSLNHLLEATTI